MSKNIILFTLQTFSSTGGIQKMTRTLGHSLNVLAKRNNWDFGMWSLYDKPDELMPQYLPADRFRGFGRNRWNFISQVLVKARSVDIIILSHINLSVIGLLIKAINPKCQVWLIAHGIEVWRPLSSPKKMLLRRCDKIICVSSFTRQQMIGLHQVDPDKCTVLNNAVDPFMKLPVSFQKPEHLLKQHWLTPDNQVIFTLTRLASTEQYKGHDQVIKVISRLKERFPQVRYVLAGEYDHKEEIRIQKLISEYQVDKEVVLPGFIAENDLSDYFLLADMFVLPSKKEGFGIVFIEALACGLPVICGNVDGSTDAIRDGELGKAINPDDLDELEKALSDYLSMDIPERKRQALQKQCLMHFNEADYMNYIEKLIRND